MEKKINLKDVSEELLDVDERTQKVDKGPKFGKRHGQILLQFFTIFMTNITRAMLSVTIIAMTDPKTSISPDIPTFKWSNKSVILSAYFWGYITSPIPGGWLANKFGPKWFLIGTGFIAFAMAAITPTIATNFGSEGVIVCRVIQGICQGFVCPCIHNLLSEWAPVTERTRCGSFVYGGALIGILTTMFISGMLAGSRYGWPSVFYFFSGVGLVWCTLFTIYGYNSPKEHPAITEEELSFISSSTFITKEKKHIPYDKIVTSVPIWALVLTQCCYTWAFDLNLTQVPNYISKVLNFDMQQNAYLSPLPYLAFWLFGLATSFIADFLIVKKILSISCTRKVLSAIAFIIPSILMIWLGNCDSSQPILSYVLLLLIVGLSGLALSGLFLNEIDLVPNYAGAVMGIVYSICNIFGVFSTLSCQYIVKNEPGESVPFFLKKLQPANERLDIVNGFIRSTNKFIPEIVAGWFCGGEISGAFFYRYFRRNLTPK